MYDPAVSRWPLTDDLGMDREFAVQDAANGVTSVADRRVLIAYGDLKSETNADVHCIFRFTGRPADAATGMQSNLNRWYDAKVGRWLDEDPLGLEAGDANVTRYCGNIPASAADPAGLRLPVSGPWKPSADPKIQDGPPATVFDIPPGSMIFVTDVAPRGKTWLHQNPPYFIHVPNAVEELYETIPWSARLYDKISCWSDVKEILKTVPDNSLPAIVLDGHGAYQGGVQASKHWLDLANLTPEISALINKKLKADGVLVVLGCEQGEDAEGRAAVMKKLATFIGHPVIANTGDVTGAKGSGRWRKFLP